MKLPFGIHFISEEFKASIYNKKFKVKASGTFLRDEGTFAKSHKSKDPFPATKIIVMVTIGSIITIIMIIMKTMIII